MARTRYDADKIPFGGLNIKQMETLADLAEEYSDEILHITTRDKMCNCITFT